MKRGIGINFYMLLIGMKKVDFVFRYEHKVREIESLMLLRLELERRGYTVDFVGNYEYDRKDFSQPRVFIAPAVYTDNQLKGDILRYGMLKKIANLQWEQLIGIKEEEDPHGFHNIVGLGQRIVTFCWGQRSHDRFVNTGVVKNMVPVVGQINTDLLRFPLKRLLMTKQQLGQKYQIDIQKKWYLFVSSFAYCEMDQFQAQLAKEELGEEGFNEFTRVSYESRDAILDWFEKKLVEIPDTIIIYRPHPDETERCQRLKDIAAKYSNFRVIPSEAMKHWVNACDKIYNWFSTGVVDVIVMGKPLRMLRPVHIPEYLDYRMMIDAHSITNQNDFDDDFEDMTMKEVIDRHMFESYYHLSSKPVFKSICDILETMLKTNKYDIKYTIAERIKWIRILAAKYIKHIIKISILRVLPTRFYPQAYKKILKDREEIAQMLKGGYEKNVASQEEIAYFSKIYRPLIYGEEV